MQNILLFSYRVTKVNLDIFVLPTQKTIINTINPHSYCVAKSDETFQEALQGSDILLADGIGITKAIKLLHKQAIQKIAGSDIHRFLLDKAQANTLKVFYLGAAESTLSLITKKISKEYPGVNVGTYSPPYKASFNRSDTQAMIEAVNAFAPDILFVGMTAPKQEKWVYANQAQLKANTICCIGAVFDFYAGTVKRPPQWLINIGLEWFGRLLKEPKRMWQRNFVSTPTFVFDVLMEKFRLVLQKH